jgi:acetate kinase
MNILIANVGSTSLKSKFITIDNKNEVYTVGEAQVDKIHSSLGSDFKTRKADSEIQHEAIEIRGLKNCISLLLNWYYDNNLITETRKIEAVGFKCVMGVSNGAHILTDAILDEMRRFSFVAPAHNLPYIEAINEFKKRVDAPLVGVFEPSFHYSVPEFRRYLGLPVDWKEMGIAKLGFHGASHRYLSAKAFQLLGRKTGKVITAHLGGSSSICAIKDGKSIDIDQHFSPNSGLMQGTRTGDTDATAVLYAMKELGISIEETQELLSHQSGLKSMAGLDTEDVKTIHEAAMKGNESARMTLDLYIDGIRKHIAGFATVLGGIDALVFSGGTGENSAWIREKCLQNMEFMGLIPDAEKNNASYGTLADISHKKSKVKIWIIPSNEELVVSYFTKKVVEKGSDINPEEMEFSL